MKLLVTGASGFLGRRTAAYLQSLGHEVLTPAHTRLDITDAAAVRNWFREYAPEAVIHTAAVSDTGLCQRKPEWSEGINVTGCVHLAESCREFGGKLLICSSDQIYVGSCVPGPHRETEPVSPGNVYGNQKLRAEQSCLECLPDTVCLRLSWMYSTKRFPGEKGHFLSSLKGALEEEALPLTWPVSDRRGITDVDAVIRNLPAARNLPGGVYNFGSENDMDTFHMVRSVLEELGMEAALARLTPNREVTFGRRSSNEIQFPDNTVGVSRQQCSLLATGTGELLARDAGSSYGTYLNNKRLGKEWVRVIPGSRLRFGNEVFQLNCQFLPK